MTALLFDKLNSQARNSTSIYKSKKTNKQKKPLPNKEQYNKQQFSFDIDWQGRSLKRKSQTPEDILLTWGWDLVSHPGIH